RARFAEGCAPLDSAKSSFAVIAPVPSCTPLEAPAIATPSQISSGVIARLQWPFVPGATGYVVEDLTDASSSFTAEQQMQLTFTNGSGAPRAHSVRVHAVDAKCAPPGSGPFSAAGVLYVLPEKGSEGSTMLSDPADIEYPLTIPAELAGRSFIATPTV